MIKYIYQTVVCNRIMQFTDTKLLASKADVKLVGVIRIRE